MQEAIVARKHNEEESIRQRTQKLSDNDEDLTGIDKEAEFRREMIRLLKNEKWVNAALKSDPEAKAGFAEAQQSLSKALREHTFDLKRKQEQHEFEEDSLEDNDYIDQAQEQEPVAKTNKILLFSSL